MSRRDDLDMASKAFGLMSLSEKEKVLDEFAKLRYPSVIDRFFDAVHRVITDRPSAP
jgi:hypothetical protein